MKNPEIHVVSLDPGYNATNLNNYTGTMEPAEGSKFMVSHVLERLGKSPGFYGKEGEVPW